MLRSIASCVVAVVVVAGCSASDPSRGDDVVEGQAAVVAGEDPGAVDACRHPPDDDCSFYESCLEPARPCGQDGYALAFGEPNCKLFLERKDDFSPPGQLWLRSVRRCLQEALVHDLDDRPTCSALSDEAFLSHSRCYTQPGASICDLSARDLTALLRLIRPGRDQHLFRQVTSIAAACALSVSRSVAER